MARIFSVCDVYDALTSLRPYKAAWSCTEALQEIRKQAGVQFDPQVVQVFLALHPKAADAALETTVESTTETGWSFRPAPTAADLGPPQP